MAVKPETIETIQQWGIKAISKRVVDEITAAAPKMDPKHTSGQMIEKMWEFWKANGAVQQPVDMIAELAKIIQAAGPFSEHNPMPGDVRKFLNAYARAAMANTLGQLAAPSAEAKKIPRPSQDEGVC